MAYIFSSCMPENVLFLLFELISKKPSLSSQTTMGFSQTMFEDRMRLFVEYRESNPNMSVYLSLSVSLYLNLRYNIRNYRLGKKRGVRITPHPLHLLPLRFQGDHEQGHAQGRRERTLSPTSQFHNRLAFAS